MGILSQDCSMHVQKGYFEQIRDVFDFVELESISKKKTKKNKQHTSIPQISIDLLYIVT